jgi:hypothetical protein
VEKPAAVSTDSLPEVTETRVDGTTRRSRRGYWIPGLIAMIVLLAIGLVLGAGDLQHRTPTTLHGSDVAQEISFAIQAQEGALAPPVVRCPGAEPVRVGWRFGCTVIEAGSGRAIQVTEIDSRGHLRWSLSS